MRFACSRHRMVPTLHPEDLGVRTPLVTARGSVRLLTNRTHSCTPIRCAVPTLLDRRAGPCAGRCDPHQPLQQTNATRVHSEAQLTAATPRAAPAAPRGRGTRIDRSAFTAERQNVSRTDHGGRRSEARQESGLVCSTCVGHVLGALSWGVRARRVPLVADGARPWWARPPCRRADRSNSSLAAATGGTSIRCSLWRRPGRACRSGGRRELALFPNGPRVSLPANIGRRVLLAGSVSARTCRWVGRGRHPSEVDCLGFPGCRVQISCAPS